MKITFGKIILEDWVLNSLGEPCRYSTTYRDRIDGAIILYRRYIDDPKYNWAWWPDFSHQLYPLNQIYQRSFGLYIKGTPEFVQIKIDNFLMRLNNLKSMM